MVCATKCAVKGLPILPVRYAVVPADVDGELPSWAQDSEITDIPLANGEKYVLRALRQGYLYVFYEQGEKGTNYWQSYSVAANGSLWWQGYPLHPFPYHKSMCGAPHHDPVNVEFMCIESPEQCGRVWFAYSQYPWSEETLARYKANPELRAQRMQKIHPRAWLDNMLGILEKPGKAASESVIETVIEYQPILFGKSFLTAADNSNFRHASEARALYNPERSDIWRVHDYKLEMESSLYPWANEWQRDAAITLERMQARSEGSTPLVLPLWDAIGITHELNGWCQDALGHQAQFIEERQLEIATLANLEGLKTIITEKAKKQADIALLIVNESSERLLEGEQLASRTRGIEEAYAHRPEILAQLREDNALLASWRGQHVDKKHIVALLSIPLEPVAQHKARVAEIQARVEQEIAERPTVLAQQVAQDWAPYQAHLNQERLDNFTACQEYVNTMAHNLFQARVKSVLNWLEAPLLLTTLDDFYDSCERGAVLYQSAVSLAIQGINHCPLGAEKLEGWWNEYSAQKRSNLLWRHVAANNPKIIAELEPLLAQIKAQQAEPVTENNASALLAGLMGAAGAMKNFLDYYGSAMGEYQYQHPLNKNTRHIEKMLHNSDAFLVTIGDRLTRLLSVDRVGETFSTSAFRFVFMLRAGVPLEQAQQLIQDYLKEAPGLRRHVEESFRQSSRFMAPKAEVETRKLAMSTQLQAYLESEQGKTTHRRARINSLLLIFNALDFIYLSTRLKDDIKSQASLVATGLAMVTQTSELIMPALEEGIKAHPATVAWVKGMGAIAGVGSSAISVFIGALSVRSERINNRYFLASVLGMRVFVDGLTGVKFTGVFLDKIGYREAALAIENFLNKKILGIRLLAVLMTWEVQVALLLLQTIAVWVSDDDLQVWCKQCVFGIKPKRLSLEEQHKKLEAAIKAIL